MTRSTRGAPPRSGEAPCTEIPEGAALPWRVLIVDDDEDVHLLTREALDDFRCLGHPVDFFSAHSGREARLMLRAGPAFAVIITDLVMESRYSGLELVRYLRDELGQRMSRVLLRTGHQEVASENEVMVHYEINDYLPKSAAGDARLVTAVRTALRTYRDLLELEQARRQQLAALMESRARSEFLSLMNQDLGPHVLGLANLGNLLRDTPLSDLQSGIVDRILSHCAALRDDSNRLLEFAAFDSGPPDAMRSQFRLRELLDDLTAHLQPILDRRSVQLQIRIDPAIPTHLAGDPGKLHQLLLKLLGRAAFRSVGGTLMLGIVRLDETGHERLELGFEIDYRGRPIGPTTAQDSATDSRHAEMAASRRLIRLMGGALDVSTTAGGLSRVFLSLAFDTLPGRADVPAPSAAAAAAAPTRVLLVEDNGVNGRVMNRMLQRLGVLCETVHNGTDAVERARTRQYAGILINCGLPGVEGYETCRLLRSLPGNESLPIIFMSAGALPETTGQCEQAGVNGFLQKPVCSKELQRVLQSFSIH